MLVFDCRQKLHEVSVHMCMMCLTLSQYIEANERNTVQQPTLRTLI